MYWFRWVLVSILVGLTATGCVSRAGIAEFQVYNNIFVEAASAAEPIIAILRNEERVLKRGRINNGKTENGVAVDVASGIAINFDPAHAEILSDTADPPFTHAVRGAVAVLQSYNEIMIKYAEGTALDALRAEAKKLQNEAIGAASTLAGAAGGSFALGAGAKVALGTIEEVAGTLSKSGSRQAFRAELVKREPEMLTLLDELISSTVVAYDLVTRRSQRVVLRGAATANAEREKVETRRKMLAEWVVLLRNSKIALRSAVAAIKDGGGTFALVSGSAEAMAEIHSSAQRIRDLAAQAN